MSRRAETHYAVHDGVTIGYQVMGEGPPDLLLIPDGYMTTEALNEEPSAARFIERLASFSRLVRYDRRGMGISDRLAASDPPTLEQWVDDALVVLDDAGSARTAVIGVAEGSFVATVLAAMHPERVASVVLVHPAPGGSRLGATQLVSHSHMELDDHTEAVWRGEISDADWSAIAPSKVGDVRYLEWWVRSSRNAMSPSFARALSTVGLWSDVDHLYPSISAPTLVLHRRDNRFITSDYSRFVASEIPGARLVELPGADHVPYLGETSQLLGEIEEFLTGARDSAGDDRVLATVLFSDLVASTEKAATLGDRQWREVLDRHDEAVERSLSRYRGRLVKGTGDGILATFDGPVRAVKCAVEIREVLAGLGLSSRQGIHTGEIEVRGEDVSGIAVHIAARVQTHAGPDEIYVSEAVPPLVIGSGLRFSDRGRHELKGVPGEWALLAVEAPVT